MIDIFEKSRKMNAVNGDFFLYLFCHWSPKFCFSFQNPLHHYDCWKGEHKSCSKHFWHKRKGYYYWAFLSPCWILTLDFWPQQCWLSALLPALYSNTGKEFGQSALMGYRPFGFWLSIVPHRLARDWALVWGVGRKWTYLRGSGPEVTQCIH